MSEQIQGAKGGSASAHTPVEQADDLLSVAKLKMLVAVSEGELAGDVTPQNIFLNDTPLANADGSYNFTGVKWEFRRGTQDQSYIQGLPEVDNELSAGITVKQDTPWTRQLTNSVLDAVRIKLSLPAQYKYQDNGDMVGTVTQYAIDLATDGGSFQTVVNGKFDGKTTSEYQRDHRINLPKTGSNWTLRVRRITADSTDSKLVNAFKVFSFAEVIDSKLRYPNTALLYVEVDSEQFSGGAPKVTCQLQGKVIRVPDNYDPVERTYTGSWSGSFKLAYSNNPAWIFYDLLLDKIYGMGNRVDATMIDKWGLYQIAQYCDESVSDGAGGKQPRFTCNVFIQSQEEAYSVLKDLAAVFRGITFWGNEQIVVTADTPVADVDWVYTAANVVDGMFSYAGGSYKNRYTSCHVSYSDPLNHYADTVESVYDPDLVARYGVQEMSLTAIGCTSQSEAHRRGRWALLSNAKDATVSFSVGLEGHVPQPSSIIGIADPYRSGKQNGGRIAAVNGNAITLDRAVDFGKGDRLIINLPDGTSQTRTIGSISEDKKTLTVNMAYSKVPVAGAVWIIDSDNLAIQQFRVTSITDNDDGTFTIAAVQYDPNKFQYIDDGVKIQPAPITVTPTSIVAAPGNITVSQSSHTSQGLTVSSLQVAWDKVEGAINYTAQWRKDNGEWVNVGLTTGQGFTVQNIYRGVYQVRVRAINAANISSPWSTSEAVTLMGKQGTPPTPVNLTASQNTVLGIDLTWNFAQGSDDGLKTTLRVSTKADHSDEVLLADIPYPQSRYSLTGLAAGVTRYFRAAFTDKSGNQSSWTDYVTGQSSSSASDVLSYISGEISKTDLGKDLITEIDDKASNTDLDNARAEANQAIAEAKAAADAIQQEANTRADALLNEANARKADIQTVQTLIQNDSESLAQQIAQVAAGTGEQFDPLKIWYFDDKSTEGWSGNGNPTVTRDGWLRPADSDAEFAVSPAGLAIDGKAYQFIKVRIKKIGAPKWFGKVLWRAAGQDFNDINSVTVAEPEFDAKGIATLTVHDIPWSSAAVDQFKLNLTTGQTTQDYVLFDWIAVGRPTPGAGMAALQQEQTARVEADAAEATQRNTLAVQLRGPYEGTDAEKVTSGLLYSEKQLRISGDKAEASARQALQSKLDNSVSNINQSLDTLNTAQKAQASAISGLQSTLNTKADASALQSLSTQVNNQGDQLSSQANDLSTLKSTLTSGNNLVPNPELKFSAQGWAASNSGIDGNRTFVEANFNWAPSCQPFDVNGGDTLVCSAEIWSDTTKNVTYRVRFDGPNMSNYAINIQSQDLSAKTWTMLTGKIVVPSGATTAQLQVAHGDGVVRLANPAVFAQNVSTEAFNSLTTQVTQQGDSLTSQGNSISRLQSAITNGSNIVPNPDMLNDGQGWAWTATGQDGNRTFVEANYNYAPHSANFAVNAGDTLICAVDLWSDTTQPLVYRFRFDGPSLNNAAVEVQRQNVTANKWVAFSGSIIVPNGATTAQIQVVHNGKARIAKPTIFAQAVSAEAFNSLNTKVTQQGNSISSQASQLQRLSATVGDNSAAIQQTSQVISDVQKGVSASWTLKVQTDSNGNQVVAGIGLGADASGNSQFLVNAQRFAVISGDNGNIQSPFAVQGDQVFINSALIQDASITSAKVGDLQSSNYKEGSAGWRIAKDGSLSLNGNSGGTGRMTIDNNRIDVYDDNGVLRVRLGLL